MLRMLRCSYSCFTSNNCCRSTKSSDHSCWTTRLRGKVHRRTNFVTKAWSSLPLGTGCEAQKRQASGCVEMSWRRCDKTRGSLLCGEPTTGTRSPTRRHSQQLSTPVEDGFQHSTEQPMLTAETSHPLFATSSLAACRYSLYCRTVLALADQNSDQILTPGLLKA
jgi:hypothetical protein